MEIVEHHGEIERLRPLIEAWHAECNGTPFGMELVDNALLEHFEAFVSPTGGQILVLKGLSGRLLGMMGVCVYPSPLSGELCLEEHMWYVLPEHRSLGVSKAFILAAEAWGRKRGAKHFVLTASLLANIDADRVSKLYRRWGFQPFENVYIRAME